MRYPAPQYAPAKTHMKNVVKTSGCRPLFDRKPRYWLRRLFAALVALIVVVCFFGALFVIAEAIS